MWSGVEDDFIRIGISNRFRPYNPSDKLNKNPRICYINHEITDEMIE